MTQAHHITLSKARKRAKEIARAGAMTHAQALDQIAREAGHAHWGAMLSGDAVWWRNDPTIMRQPYVCEEMLALGIRGIGDWIDICWSKSGLAIVCGAAGSGRTTTIEATRTQMFHMGMPVGVDDAASAAREGRIDGLIKRCLEEFVLVEAEGEGIDKAIAGMMHLGFDNAALSKVFVGGIHQRVTETVAGRQVEAMVLSWPDRKLTTKA